MLTASRERCATTSQKVEAEVGGGWALFEVVVEGLDAVDWISRVAADEMIAISRDARISRRVAELDSVVQHRARLVVLSSADARTVWGKLEVLMHQWRRIEEFVGLPSPFIYRASRTQLRPVPLP